jgi:hypothetical protein
LVVITGDAAGMTGNLYVRIKDCGTALEPVTFTAILYSTVEFGAADSNGVPESTPLELRVSPGGNVEFVENV